MTSDPLKKAEEILVRYIQERKKPLAELALETLVELAPDHPRRREYTQWVAELDQELALQNRIDSLLSEGRTALRRGDADTARSRLEALRKVDPDAAATVALAQEIESAQEDQAQSAGIGRLKETVDGYLERGALDAAEAAIGRLAQQSVPKLTVDFYRRRLSEARVQARDAAEAQAIEQDLEARLTAKDWQGAREVAHRFGERFPASSRAAEMFNRVGEIEANERRQLSIRQGVATVEQFLAQGDATQARLALKLLRSLDPDANQLAELEARVAAL